MNESLRPKLSLDANVRLSLRDHVREELRAAIISGRFAADERLNERALAEELEVSTTPLKEALRQLESEGLVEVMARRGVFVRFDAEFAEEMIIARASLESPLASLAAQRADKESKGRLGSIVKKMSHATADGDIPLLISLNEEFHGEIHLAARSRHLARLANQQQLYDEKARRVIHAANNDSARALAEHTAICDAIVDGDADSAGELMSRHVLRSGQLYLSAVFQRDRDES